MNLCEAERESGSDPAGPCLDKMRPLYTNGSRLPLLGLAPPVSSSFSDVSTLSPGDTGGLLSLPKEILTHIISHLPAHCVINVLPKVCQALRTADKDSFAWKLRAQRITGSSSVFPVGPKEDFEWPTACLEMEELATCWTRKLQHVTRQYQGTEQSCDQGRPQERGPHEDAWEDTASDALELVGVEVQEVAEAGRGVVLEPEDGEMWLEMDEDQIARLGEALEEGQENGAAALTKDGGKDLHAALDGPLDGQNDLTSLDHFGTSWEVEMMNPPPSRSPSPPPALECITLPQSHFSNVNSVLLLGGEGGVCATASRDRNVKLWDLQAGSKGTLLYTLGRRGDFSTHQGWVWCLGSEGPLLASGGFDGTVRLWDLQAGGTDRGVFQTGSAVICLACQKNMLFAGTFDKKIHMYDTRVADPLTMSFRLHNSAVMCLAADDKYIISGSEGRTVAIYDHRAGKLLKKIKLSSFLLYMSRCGHEVWAGDSKGKLQCFSLQAGKLNLLSQFDVGHTALVTGIHKSVGSLYSCSSDGTVKIHIPSAPPRTLCTLQYQSIIHGLSVEAGVLAVASGEFNVDIWRARK